MKRRTSPWLGATLLLTVACAGVSSTRPASSSAVDEHREGPRAAKLGDLVDAGVAARVQAPPLELQTRSGAAVPIAQLSVRAFDRDPLVFTELRVTFDRNEPRSTQGTFSAQLPEGARIVRFAVGQEGRWREAQVTPRRPASDTAPRVRTETALAWNDEEARFVAELPHVPARGPVSMVLSYVQVNEHAEPGYTLALAGLPRVGAFDAQVFGVGEGDGGARQVAVSHDNWLPEDLEVDDEVERSVGVRHGELAVARVPALHHDHSDPLGGLTILFDTSASRALGFEAQIGRLAELLDALEVRVGGGRRVRLIAFDQTTETIFEGELGDLDADAFELLRARRPLGASDLGRALYLAGLRRGDEYDRLLVVSDGRITAGRELDSVLASAARLGEAGYRRLDVLVDDTVRDEATLDALTRALPLRGAVLDGDRAPRELSQRMLRSVASVRVSVPGAVWSYPETLDAVQGMDEVVVYAELPADADADALEVAFDGGVHDEQWTRSVPLEPVEAGLVQDAVANARIESLEAALWQASGLPVLYRQKYWSQIVDLSRRHRIVNDFTALAVPPDGAPRPATAPMLVAGPSAVMQVEAKDPEVESTDGTVVAVPRLEMPELTANQLMLLADGEPGRSEASALDDRDALDRALVEAGEGVAHAGVLESEFRTADDEERALLASMRSDLQLSLADGPFARPSASGPVAPATRDPSRRRAQDLAHRFRRAVGLEDARQAGGPSPSRAPGRDPGDAHAGNLLAVMNLLRWGQNDAATEFASAWRSAEPRDVMALVALGEALEVSARTERAARAYGSIVDLYPERADMRRFAGARLEVLDGGAQRLALDAYRVARRLDVESEESHRRLAYALLREGRPDRAFEVLAQRVARDLEPDREGDSGGAPSEQLRLLRQDLGLLGAAWIAVAPEERNYVDTRLARLGAELAQTPSLRFVLTWDTSGKDVDLHVRDGAGGHAYYDNPSLRSGGSLGGDGKGRSGSETLVVPGTARAYPYRLEAHVHATGADGFAAGRVQVIEHDGRGGLRVTERPFITSKDRAVVDLGVLDGPLHHDAVAKR